MKSFFSRVNYLCQVFLKKQKSKRKKSDCIVFRVYNPNFKNCFSLVEKKNKTLSSVNIKGGASLFFFCFPH